MSIEAVNLSHTPGIYYAVGYCLSAFVFLANLKKRFPLWKTLLFSGMFLVFLGFYMTWTDGTVGWRFACVMLSIFGLLFLFFLALTELPREKALYFTVRAFILGEFAAAFEWQMFYFGLTRLNIPLRQSINLLILAVIHFFIFGAAYRIEKHYRESNEELNISWRELTVVLLLGFLIYLLSDLSFVSPDTPFSGKNDADIFALRTLADLSGVALFLAYHMQLCESSSRMEKEYLHKLLHMQKENYRISEESVELVNRKYHDLKHQIQLLRSEISAADKLHYLDEMEQEIRAYEAQNKTGNKTLDTLLTAKSLKCQDMGISLTCVADGEELAFLKPTDLGVLFGNALDNAIESVEKISDPEKRLIHLSVMRQKSFLRIRVENCCEGEVLFADGLPVTGKDARYHGYGMKSIRSIVEKYNGSMAVKVENGWFELRILLPISSQAPSGNGQ